MPEKDKSQADTMMCPFCPCERKSILIAWLTGIDHLAFTSKQGQQNTRRERIQKKTKEEIRPYTKSTTANANQEYARLGNNDQHLK